MVGIRVITKAPSNIPKRTRSVKRHRLGYPYNATGKDGRPHL